MTPTHTNDALDTPRGVQRVETLKPSSEPGSSQYEPLGWSVQLRGAGPNLIKLFHDERYGGTANALQAAIAYRDGLS